MAHAMQRRKDLGEEEIMAQTSARIGRHPVHPMLVVLPLGLWIGALAFDVVHAITGDQLWRTLAFLRSRRLSTTADTRTSSHLCHSVSKASE